MQGRRHILESGGLERILHILVTTPTNIVYVESQNLGGLKPPKPPWCLTLAVVVSKVPEQDG